jgi:uracil-DNA glycosylase family 4
MNCPSSIPVSDNAGLIADARACRACERMGNSRRVLSDLNGSWNAPVMFVAEAPGRLGAELTGIPLFGDRTGDRFRELLARMRWERASVFVTNAVLCNPRDEKGNNDGPKQKEVENCSHFLLRTIVAVNPKLVVALGRVALESLGLIEQHGRELRKHAGETAHWYGRTLAVLYHPGPRSAVHRGWPQQLRDAERIAEFAESSLGIRRTERSNLG